MLSLCKKERARISSGRGNWNESETNRNPKTHMSKNVEYRNEMDRDVRSGDRNRSSRGSGNWKWARMSERARHTGDGVARRKAHQERQRDERELREEADRAAGTALPPDALPLWAPQIYECSTVIERGNIAAGQYRPGGRAGRNKGKKKVRQKESFIIARCALINTWTVAIPR